MAVGNQVRRGETGFHLEASAAAGRQAPLVGDAPTGDEDRADEPCFRCRNEQAAPHPTQPLEPREVADQLLQRRDAVAEACRIFVAAAVREVAQALTESRQRQLRAIELLRGCAVERPACQPCACPASQRPELRRRLRADELVAAPSEVHVPIGACVARVRRGPELAEQAQFLQRRFELGPGDSPLDPLERRQRSLHRRTLTIGPEVRAKTRPEITGAADVQDLVVTITEEVDAR